VRRYRSVFDFTVRDYTRLYTWRIPRYAVRVYYYYQRELPAIEKSHVPNDITEVGFVQWSLSRTIIIIVIIMIAVAVIVIAGVSSTYLDHRVFYIYIYIYIKWF